MYAFLLAVVFHPSKEIAKQLVFQPHIHLPKEFSAGQTLVFKKDVDLKFISINQKKMSLIGKNHLLGVVPLYGGNTVKILGQWEIQKLSWLEKQFSHPSVDYFVEYRNVKKHPLKQASNLRIPASVWKKVNDDHADLKEQQKQKMKKLLSQVPSQDFQLDCYKAPINSVVVSKFASPRTLPNGYSYYHSGLDQRARVPSSIKSIGPGKVVFAEHMIVPGNTLVIDHGGGVYSRFMHLSDFRVEPGSKIQTGQVVATTGATGRVEAPHLHWEVVWKGNHANPSQFLQALEPICDQG